MAGESAREVARRSREKAERLSWHAEMYERGAAGEERTAEVLSTLPPGWTVLNDVRWPGRRRANIDHIVIGPPGIFVIDSKNWSGRVYVDGSTLRQNGRSRETAVAACADAALAVSELAGDFAQLVMPVLCFVRDAKVAGWARDVAVCSTSNLLELLLSRPVRLTDEQVRRASCEIDAQLRAAAAGAARGNPRHRSPVPARGSLTVHERAQFRSRRRKGRRSLAKPVVGLLLILGALTVGPRAATAFGDAFVHAMTSGVGTQSCPASAAGMPPASSRRC